MMDLDMADQESLAGDAERPRTTTPSQIQAQENEHSKSEEDHPGRASDAPSRLDNRSASFIVRRVRSPAPSPDPSPPSPPLPGPMPRPSSPSAVSHSPPSSPSPSLPLACHEMARKLALVMEAGDLNSSPCDGRGRPAPAAPVTSQSMRRLWEMPVVLSWLRSLGFCLTRADMSTEPLLLEIMGPDERY